MKRITEAVRILFGLGFGFILSGCGMVSYPGQPGLVTNGYSKIDLEIVDDSGLWVYEANYDNRPGQLGVGALVTKLYPGASRYTSNSRENGAKVVYREKGQYKGAQVQMISIPSLQQVMMPPDSKVTMFVGNPASLNEVDDRNLAEEGIFKAAPLYFASAFGATSSQPLNRLAMLQRNFRWDLLRAGSLREDGSLEYEIATVELAGKKFTPNVPVKLQTNLHLNGVTVKIDTQLRQQLTAFIEENFATGYKGIAGLYLKGATKPLSVNLGLHTVKTAEASGMKIIRNATREMIDNTLASFAQTNRSHP